MVELCDELDYPQTASVAQSLINQIGDFTLIVILILWNEIICKVNLISKSFQGKQLDIFKSTKKFNKCWEFLDKFGNNGFLQNK